LPLHVRQFSLDPPRRRPRTHVRQDLLHRDHLLHGGVRPPELRGPPPGGDGAAQAVRSLACDFS
uniref:Uncharacterized protein n=1 Tax=Aegilops tauschii subsp. strangulata TaxID=200361 RepID=A0A453LG49_AEGTS